MQVRFSGVEVTEQYTGNKVKVQDGKTSVEDTVGGSFKFTDDDAGQDRTTVMTTLGGPIPNDTLRIQGTLKDNSAELQWGEETGGYMPIKELKQYRMAKKIISILPDGELKSQLQEVLAKLVE